MYAVLSLSLARRAAARRLLPVAALLAAVTLVGLLLPSAAASAATATCVVKTSSAQAKVERFLGRPVDGRSDLADCRAIRAFQRRNGIVPASGYAGSVTADLVSRLRKSAARQALCAPRAEVVCVDLSSQTMWTARRGVVTWGPFAVRSGRDGYETRTGTFRIGLRDIDHVSGIYGSPMPFAMFFSGGMAFHTSDRYLYDPLGSHGCVHVLPHVARSLWDRLHTGAAVQVFGRKPGT